MIAAPQVVEMNGLFVVRDDLLDGGTKRRALVEYLPSMGADEFVYASPANGYAQYALALACRDIGKRATVFTAKRGKPSALTLKAKAAGAKILMVPTGYLSNVQAKARDYAAIVGAALIPFGIDDLAFIAILAKQATMIGLNPVQVFIAAGSGTLSRALQLAFPGAEHHAVQVGHRPNINGAQLWVAPEKFEASAKLPPPFPSCSFYDAKVWRFVQQRAKPGALFWNVAA